MDYKPALNSKGRFSLNRVKQEVKKIENKPKRKLSFGWLILTICAVSLILLLWARHSASAAVFDNTSSTYPGGCMIYKNSSGQPRWGEFNFSSSTQIISINDITFPVCISAGGAPATSTIRVDISSDLGAWYSISEVFAPTCTLGGASSTHIFGYGTAVWNVASGTPAWPIYGVAGEFHFEISSDDVFTESIAPLIVQSTWMPDQFGDPLLNFCYQPPPASTTTGFMPQIKINGTEIYQAPAPNPADYYLNATSSAANQDFGFFGNMLRDIMIWLFTPSEAVKINYENEKSRLLNDKIPFAYFTDAVGSIGGVSSTTGGTEMIAGATTTLGYFEFFNTETIKANPMIDILDVIKYWLRIAMWLGFLFWLYETIKEFKP